MKKITIKKFWWILPLLAIVIGGVLLIKKRQAESNNAEKANSFPIVVNTLKTNTNALDLSLSYLAVVQNDQDVTLSSKIAARVTYLKASGSNVRAGEVIARLDNSTFQTAVSSIDAQISAQNVALQNLKNAHQRTRELYEIKGASKEQLEAENSKIADVKSKINVLQQTKKDAKNSFSYTTITAPHSGILSQVFVNTGELAMAGQPIATITARSGGFLKLNVPSNLDIKGIYYNKSFYEVTSLNSTFNGLKEYKIIVPNINAATGERIPVDIVLNANKAGISLPYDAILNREGKSYVFIVDKNKAIPQEVTITSSGENEVILDNDNLNNQQIVIAKQDILLRLLGGASIKINPKK